MTVTRIFTFGHGQTCPFTEKALLDHHVTITAPTSQMCQTLMFAMFGVVWAFGYSSIDEATSNGQFPSTEHMRIEMPGGGDRS